MKEFNELDVQVGDIVTVISHGWGLAPSELGRRIEVTEVGDNMYGGSYGWNNKGFIGIFTDTGEPARNPSIDYRGIGLGTVCLSWDIRAGFQDLN